jgi:DNA-binding beta-propeller fold protein YncE
MQIKRYFILFIAILFLSGCTEKFDTGELPLDVELPDFFGDTSYVQIGRQWDGFNNPHDVVVGFEPLIYVADTGNDRIVMLDIGGNVLGTSQTIPRPRALAQDRRLNLIVVAEHDTVVNGEQLSLAAIYKIDLFAAAHNIAEAPVRRVYTESVARRRIEFTGVAALHDNRYYVTRRGPQNLSPVNPDNAVLWFTRDDRLMGQEAWPNLLPEGTGLRAVNQPSAVATFPGRQTTDFVLAQTATQSQFKVQWITFRTIGDFFQWESFLTPERDEGADLLTPGRFTQPEGIVVDNTGTIFVTDAARDSVYRFNNRGIERYSFGGPDTFYQPRGIAIDPNRTLYVADSGNNRIIRFRLSTDL